MKKKDNILKYRKSIKMVDRSIGNHSWFTEETIEPLYRLVTILGILNFDKKDLEFLQNDIRNKEDEYSKTVYKNVTKALELIDVWEKQDTDNGVN